MTHLATQADLLGLAGGAALLREEGLRIRLRAERTVLPLIGGVVRLGNGSGSNATGASGTNRQVRPGNWRRREPIVAVRCACHNAPKVLIRHALSASSA